MMKLNILPLVELKFAAAKTRWLNFARMQAESDEFKYHHSAMNETKCP